MKFLVGARLPVGAEPFHKLAQPFVDRIPGAVLQERNAFVRGERHSPRPRQNHIHGTTDGGLNVLQRQPGPPIREIEHHVAVFRYKVEFGEDAESGSKSPDARNVHAADPHRVCGQFQRRQNVFAESRCRVHHDVLEFVGQLAQQPSDLFARYLVGVRGSERGAKRIDA